MIRNSWQSALQQRLVRAEAVEQRMHQNDRRLAAAVRVVRDPRRIPHDTAWPVLLVRDPLPVGSGAGGGERSIVGAIGRLHAGLETLDVPEPLEGGQTWVSSPRADR